MSDDIIELKMEIPIEHCLNIFGQFDIYMKKIENKRPMLVAADVYY